MRVAPDVVTDGFGTIARSLLVAVSVTVCPASSAPPPGPTFVIEMEPWPESSSTNTFATESNSGGSSVAVTVIWKMSENVFASPAPAVPSSVAVSVMSTGPPFESATGVYVRVRVAPDPLTNGSGMIVGSLLTASNVTV